MYFRYWLMSLCTSTKGWGSKNKQNNEKLQWKGTRKKREVSRGMFKVDKVKPIDSSCSFLVATDILLASQ